MANREADQQNYSIGQAVLNGLALLVASALFIAALFLCRRMGDAARSSVRWMKVALIFIAL